eukprot:ANDGO_04818.mRNA.1 BCP1 protein
MSASRKREQSESKKLKKSASSSEAQVAASLDSDEDSSSSEDSALDENGMMQMTFTGRDICEGDYLTIRNFLTHYLWNYDFTGVSDMSNAIIESATGFAIGSVVHTDEDPDNVFGFVSAVPWPSASAACAASSKSDGKKEEKKRKSGDQRPLFVQQIAEYCLKHTQNKHLKKVLQGESAKNTVLIVADRVINLPPEAAIPMHVSLFSEIANAAKNHNVWKADQFLLLSTLATEYDSEDDDPVGDAADDADAEVPPAKVSRTTTGQEKKGEEDMDDEPFLLRAEEEAYARVASHMDRWSIPSQGSLVRSADREHVVMLIPAEVLQDAITDMHDAFSVQCPEAR